MDVKKLNTKILILEAAIDLFSSEGFEAATFAQIAKRCKISQPAIYNHYSDKMDLMNACAIYAAQKGREYIDRMARPDLPAKARLLSYVEANLKWFGENKNYGLAFMSIYFFAGMDKSSRQLLDQIQDVSVERLKLVLIQGQHEGAWKNVAVEKVAHSIHSMLIGEVYKAMYFKAKRGESYGQNPILQAIELMLAV